jgi:hypothetical protein
MELSRPRFLLPAQPRYHAPWRPCAQGADLQVLSLDRTVHEMDSVASTPDCARVSGRPDKRRVGTIGANPARPKPATKASDALVLEVNRDTHVALRHALFQL